MKQNSEFGKIVKIELIKREKNQKWLIQTLKKRLPNMYIDTSILYKILSGKVLNGKIVNEIKNVFDID